MRTWCPSKCKSIANAHQWDKLEVQLDFTINFFGHSFIGWRCITMAETAIWHWHCPRCSITHTQHSTRVMNCQVLENVAGNNYSRTTEKRRKIILLRKERRGSAVCGIRPSSYCSYWSMQNPVGAATSKAICIRSLSIRWSRTIFFLLLFSPFRCLQHDHSSSLIDNATKKKRHKVNEWEKRREKKNELSASWSGAHMALVSVSLFCCCRFFFLLLP